MSHWTAQGFIQWPRSWFAKDHRLWAVRKTHPEWIVAFLLMNHRAAYKERPYTPDGATETIKLRRGEFVMSYSQLAKETGMNESQARYCVTRFVTHLHILEKIRETDHGNVYRIIGYGATSQSAQTFNTHTEQKFAPSSTPSSSPEVEGWVKREKRIDSISFSPEKRKSKAVASEAVKPRSTVLPQDRPAQPITTDLKAGLEQYANGRASESKYDNSARDRPATPEEVRTILARVGLSNEQLYHLDQTWEAEADAR